MGLFDKLKQGLKKTSQLLRTDIREIFKTKGRLVDEPFLEQCFEALVKTDMGVEAATVIVDELRERLANRVVESDEILTLVKQKLKDLLRQPAAPIAFAAAGPTVIMVCGVNGCGKTTSIAKLAHLLKSSGKSVVLGAADTFRAGASRS